MITHLSDSTLARVLASSEAWANERAAHLTVNGDGETIYSARQDALGAWHVVVIGADGSLIYDEVAS